MGYSSRRTHWLTTPASCEKKTEATLWENVSWTDDFCCNIYRVTIWHRQHLQHSHVDHFMNTEYPSSDSCFQQHDVECDNAQVISNWLLENES